MRVVLCGVGSHGDIQPLLGLATVLLARGHDVTLAAATNYQVVVEGVGARFHTLGASMQDLVRDEGEAVFNPIHFARLAVKVGREQLEHVVAAAAGADVVVGGVACFGAPTAAAIAGARFLWAALAPGTFPTAVAPFLLSGMAPRAAWLNRATHRLGNGAMAALLTRIVNPVRKAAGLPAIDDYASFVAGTEALYAVDDRFGATPGDWPIGAHQTGFWFHDDDAPLAPALEDFLGAGDAPVYVGFGSMPVKNAAARTRFVVDGILRSGRRGIVSSGWAGLGAELKDADGRILVVGPTNHARLFPRCAAVVHHCGAGTTAAAARAGVPQIPVPHAFDQPWWSSRLGQLGVAGAALPRDFTGAQLGDGIAAVVNDGDVVERARVLGEHIRSRSGVAAAADVITRDEAR